MDGSEDGPSRTSEAYFLANRASRGLMVRSAPFVYWTDTSSSRVRRTVGILDAELEGVGKGSRRSHPGLLPETRLLDSMRVEAALKARRRLVDLVRPQVREPAPRLQRPSRQLWGTFERRGRNRQWNRGPSSQGHVERAARGGCQKRITPSSLR